MAARRAICYPIAPMKPPVPNPGYDRTIALLREAGYHRLRSFQCSDAMGRGITAPEVGMEVWAGPKGVLLVQQWTKGCGAQVYLGWGAGQTFEELRGALL